MTKKIILIILTILIGFGLSSCQKKKSLILFNHYPISEKNIHANSTEFKTDERIYYVYLTSKPLKTEDIRVRLYKRNIETSAPNGSYGDMIYSNDFRLKKGEIYYFTDYLVLHKSGYYIMHIYRKDCLWKPDAIADFRVDAR